MGRRNTRPDIKEISIMKKLAAMIGIMLTLALGVACAMAEGEALPRVELVSTRLLGVLDLQYKNIPTTAELTYTDGKRSFTYPVMIKLQGGFTLNYEKKNYTIKFFEDNTFMEKKKVRFLDGWGKHSKYVLKANYQDCTQARNIVGARLAADMNRPYGIFPDAPNGGQTDGFPVELFVDGEYWGLYTVNIPKDGWMFGMSKKNENHLLMSAEHSSPPAVRFRGEAAGEPDVDWDIKHGPETDPDAMAVAYEKLNRAIRFVMNSTDEEYRDQFSAYFNLDAALNYYCYVLYTNTSDNMAKNLLLATLDGEVWYPMLYDLDTCFGLAYDGKDVSSPERTVDTYQGTESIFWERLVKVFPNELRERYFELRKTVFNEDYIMELFTAFESGIPADAWQREREKWPDVPGQDYGLDSIRQHIRDREGFVDGIFSRLGAE